MSRIIADAVTSGLSPEETLRLLDSFGIDWHITGEGTLMYRMWQVGAEGFVSPEQVGRLQVNRERPRDADSLEEPVGRGTHASSLA